MAIDLKEVVDRVRNELDEFTIGDDWIGASASFEDTASTNFSTEDLVDRSLGVARDIAFRVHSSHLKELIATINPTESAEFYPTTGGTQMPWFRLLLTRVRFHYQGLDNLGGAVGDGERYDAIRQAFTAYMSTGRTPSPTRPIFAYQDGEFVMKVGGSSGTWEDEGRSIAGTTVLDGTVNDRQGTAEADVVLLPFLSGTLASYNGITVAAGASLADWQTLGTGELVIPMATKFMRPIVNGVLSSCYMTMRQADISNMYFEHMMEQVKPFLRKQYRSEDIPRITQL